MFRVNAQVPGKIFGGEKFDRGIFTMKTSRGGLLLVGYSGSFSDSDDVYVIKTNLRGERIWEKNIGGSKSDFGFGAAELDNDQGYLVVGFGDSYSSDENIFLIRLSVAGEVVWSKNLPKAGRQRGLSIQKLKDGNFLIAGQTQDNATKVYRGLLTKVNAEGQVLWQSAYGNLLYNRLFYFTENRKNEIVATGICKKDSLSENTGWVLKVDNTGKQQRSYLLTSIDQTTPHGILTLPGEDIMIIGYAQLDTVRKERSIYLARLNAGRELLWERGHYEKGKVEHGLSATVTKNNTILVAGYTRDVDNPIWDAGIFEFDTNGNFKSKRQYSGTKSNNFYTLESLGKGAAVVVGHTFNSGKGEGDLWLLKVDSHGNSVSF